MRLEPLQLAPIVLLAAAYARRAHTLRRRGRPVPRRKRAWFAAGIVVLLAALVSPIDRIGETRLFWVHMVQHLLLGDLAPLAIVLGLTGAVLRPLLRGPGAYRLRQLAHPLVVLPLWALTLYVWHLPALYRGRARPPGAARARARAVLPHRRAHVGRRGRAAPGPAWFGAGPEGRLRARRAHARRGARERVHLVGPRFYPRYATGERLAGISPMPTR